MSPKTKNGPERVQPLEAYGTATHEGRRTMTDHTEYAHFEPQDETPRTTIGELAVNFALVLLGLVVAYLACVGAVATTISQGWFA